LSVLLPMIAKAVPDASRLNLYLFGSILKADPHVSDIDILIVYLEEEDILPIKKAFMPVALRFPLHITYMTESEKRRFDFINEQGAQPLDASWKGKGFRNH
jgi:predicted nucleotidyltransferase